MNRELGAASHARMVGARLRERRLAMRLTLTQLARRSGASKPWISQVETGKTPNPGRENLERVARALGCEVSDLLNEAAGGTGAATLEVPRSHVAIVRRLLRRDPAALAQIERVADVIAPVEDGDAGV